MVQAKSNIPALHSTYPVQLASIKFLRSDTGLFQVVSGFGL